MARNVRTYGHFCMLARALERVGDRWSLLVVRDLLSGPRRFTDLLALLGGITPKTLSQRLQALEEAGVVDVDREEGRREVWYALTAAGQELAPVVESLLLWGLRHARRPPEPAEAVHAEHLLEAVRVVLEHTTPPRKPITWHVAIAEGGEYALAFDGAGWTLNRHLDGLEPDLTIAATTGELARYLTTPPPKRSVTDALEVLGAAAEVRRFERLMGRFPDGADR